MSQGLSRVCLWWVGSVAVDQMARNHMEGYMGSKAVHLLVRTKQKEEWGLYYSLPLETTLRNLTFLDFIPYPKGFIILWGSHRLVAML